MGARLVVDDSGSWNRYQKLVLDELEKLNATNKDFWRAISKIKEDDAREKREMAVEIAILKVKAGVWGVVGGLLGTVGAILLKVLAD